jgi:hypothetical protein
MRRRVKITGKRGHWLAEAEGRWLPVIHNSWRQGPNNYLDPMTGVSVDGKRYRDYVDALRGSDLVILQRDASAQLERDGYIGIFHFKDLILGEDGSIGLTIIDRYADPAN